MNFSLSEQQLEVRQSARRFSADHIRPVAHRHDVSGEFAWDVLRKAAAQGLYGVEFYKRQASSGEGLLLPLVAEQLAWGCAGIAVNILGSGLPYYAISCAGTKDQLEYWTPQMMGTGADPKVGALAMTEPDAGSDSAAIKTSAQKRGGDWILNGNKTMIANAGIASLYVVVAAVDPKAGHRGQGCFVVESGARGLRAGPPHQTMGIRAAHVADLVLDGVVVPAGHLLGGEDLLQQRLHAGGDRGSGSPVLAALQMTRPHVACQAVGVASAALEYAVNHAAGREQFGRKLIEHQGVSHALADVAAGIDAARLLCYRAAEENQESRGGRSGRANMHASMAKLKAAEAAVKATNCAVQVLGGRGYLSGTPVEKWYRDARIYGLFEGASEIQKNIIAANLLQQLGSQ